MRVLAPLLVASTLTLLGTGVVLIVLAGAAHSLAAPWLHRSQEHEHERPGVT